MPQGDDAKDAILGYVPLCALRDATVAFSAKEGPYAEGKATFRASIVHCSQRRRRGTIEWSCAQPSIASAPSVRAKRLSPWLIPQSASRKTTRHRFRPLSPRPMRTASRPSVTQVHDPNLTFRASRRSSWTTRANSGTARTGSCRVGAPEHPRLRDRRRAGPRRHGNRLQGPPDQAQPRRRAQDDPGG